jgi:hypothetical protein
MLLVITDWGTLHRYHHRKAAMVASPATIMVVAVVAHLPMVIMAVAPPKLQAMVVQVQPHPLAARRLLTRAAVVVVVVWAVQAELVVLAVVAVVVIQAISP